MKKTFIKLFGILLLFSVLVGCVSCGEKRSESLFANYSGELVAHKDMNPQEAAAFFSDMKASNPTPTSLDLKNGVRINIFDKIDMAGTIKISKFDMYLQEVDGVMIAEGSFTTSATIQGETVTAESVFYHDGTYLGIQTKENGKTDKQREELPIENIGNLIGRSNFISEVVTAVSNPPDIDALITAAENTTANASFYVNTYTGPRCVAEEFLFVSTNVTRVWDDPTTHHPAYIVFDPAYNILGYNNIIDGFDFRLEITDTAVTIPSDFDTWTLRPQA